ncbi:MAG: hypothetical protein JXB49_11340 [Bacteroidales bacterium]|nr:hypothetical protein [Bacteroidales bacterium]
MEEIIHSSKIKGSTSEFGGKAEGLFFLKKRGFRVPDFFLLSSGLIDSIVTGDLRVDEFVDNWIKKNKISRESLWAVRSSANVEDGKEQSYAGLFQTVTNVKPKEMASAIKEVIQSYSNVKGLNYGNVDEKGISVIIQKMIQPDYAGVVFSKDPLQEVPDAIIVNIIPGLGENLVSGKEEAITGSYYNSRMHWKNKENVYCGEAFKNEKIQIQKSGIDIIKDVQHHIKALLKRVRKIEKLKKLPVDIEFAIANNRIYWLQVRPITTIEEGVYNWIYDNANIGDNYPGITLPLSISLVQESYFYAYSSMAKYLGMSRINLKRNEVLFKNMVGGIYGGLYYNITAWQQLLYQLPFGKKTGQRIPKLLGMEDAVFQVPQSRTSIFGYLRLFAKIISAFTRLGKLRRIYQLLCENTLRENAVMDFYSMTHEELIRHYKTMEAKLAANWLAPVLNGFYAMLLLSLVKRMIRNSKLLKNYPNFINDMLYSQGDIISVNIVHEFQDLIYAIQKDTELKAFFQSHTPEVIYSKLPQLFHDYYSRVCAYISKYGERCEEGEQKMEIKNHKDNPEGFIALLKMNANSEYHSSLDLTNFDYRTEVKKHYRLRFIKRFLLLQTIRVTLYRIRDRENLRFYRTRIYGLIRTIFRAMDSDLLKQKFIETKGDSLYLEYNELLDIGVKLDYKRIINERKVLYADYEKMERIQRYRKIGDKLIPIDTSGIYNKDKVLKGTGCCSGIAKEKVKIVSPKMIGSNDYKGCILVGKYFEPGWINLFVQAAGIISERGNILSHTAILCREMGIPSIVGVKGITKMVQDGDEIQMNGATGEVELIKKNEVVR